MILNQLVAASTYSLKCIFLSLFFATAVCPRINFEITIGSRLLYMNRSKTSGMSKQLKMQINLMTLDLLLLYLTFTPKLH